MAIELEDARQREKPVRHSLPVLFSNVEVNKKVHFNEEAEVCTYENTN